MDIHESGTRCRRKGNGISWGAGKRNRASKRIYRSKVNVAYGWAQYEKAKKNEQNYVANFIAYSDDIHGVTT
jgi:hypothetical protein